MLLCGVSPKMPYCVVITSIFLKIWNGRESHQAIKACSKRQTASIVLFQDFQRGTIMYCTHLARIDSSIKPRHLIQIILYRQKHRGCYIPYSALYEKGVTCVTMSILTSHQWVNIFQTPYCVLCENLLR